MGGTIKLESTAGEGTTMTIRVPLDKAPSEIEPSDPPLPAPVNGNGDAAAVRTRSPESVRILLAEGMDFYFFSLPSLFNCIASQITN